MISISGYHLPILQSRGAANLFLLVLLAKAGGVAELQEVSPPMGQLFQELEVNVSRRCNLTLLLLAVTPLMTTCSVCIPYGR